MHVKSVVRRNLPAASAILVFHCLLSTCFAQQPNLPGTAGQFAPQANRARSAPVDIRALAIGDQVTTSVTGRNTGPLWGDSVYTLDSDLGTAAVHAGLVQVGETKRIRVWVVPPPASFAGASRNGVQSRQWGPYHAAFVMQAAPSPAVPRCGPMSQSAGILSRLEEGESATLPITGSDRGALWGTDRYTGDSSLEAAAVHSGALRVGERATVIVTRVPPLERYEASYRNGLQSSAWGAYPTCFTIERKP